MGSPPPYYSPSPKKSKTGLIIGIILGAVCLCCILPIILLAGGGFWAFNQVKDIAGCSMTFTNLQRAVSDYAEAHDGKLPNAATWETDIKPFYQKQVAKHAEEQKIFTNGSDGSLGCSNKNAATTGISFNKELSGKKLSSIKNPFETVLLFEVPAAGSNLNASYKALPFSTSPKIFNTPRGWYVCHLNGSTVLIDQNGASKPVDVQGASVRVDSTDKSSNN